jgi:hypothetical protein
MMSIKANSFGKHRPQNPRILVGQRHHRLLPARLLAQLVRPLGDRIIPPVRGQHRCSSALNQQSAQVNIASLGNGAQTGLAAAGALARH